MTEPEDKGFTVHDRRFHQQSEEEKERQRQAAQEREAAKAAYDSEATKAAAEAQSGSEGPLPEITFASFIMSLGTSVFFHLGDLPHPETGQAEKNLPMAKQTIDLLGLLREKTKNNLTPEEENIFDHLLYDLRMRYVKEVTKAS